MTTERENEMGEEVKRRVVLMGTETVGWAGATCSGGRTVKVRDDSRNDSS